MRFARQRRAQVASNSLQSGKKRKSSFSHMQFVQRQCLLLIIMLITDSSNSHFQMDESELTPGPLLITSHLDDKVKANIHSHLFTCICSCHTTKNINKYLTSRNRNIFFLSETNNELLLLTSFAPVSHTHHPATINTDSSTECVC